MILPAGQMGSAALTLSRPSLAAADALAAAALTAWSALGPEAIKDLRSLASDASTAARSITDLPSTNPRAAPWPFSNIISRIARVSSSSFCPRKARLSARASATLPASPAPSLREPHELAAALSAGELGLACTPLDEPRSHALRPTEHNQPPTGAPPKRRVPIPDGGCARRVRKAPARTTPPARS